MLDGCFIIKSFSLSLSLSLPLFLSLSLSSLPLSSSLSLKLSQNGSLKRNTSTLSQLERSHNVSPTRSLTHALSSTLTPPVLRALKTAFSSAYGTPRIPLSSACGTLCILQCVPLFTTVCTSSLLQCVQLFIARTRLRGRATTGVHAPLKHVVFRLPAARIPKNSTSLCLSATWPSPLCSLGAHVHAGRRASPACCVSLRVALLACCGDHQPRASGGARRGAQGLP